MVYESKTENHCLIFTAGSAAVLTLDLCMHQRTHSVETVQTRVYHATSSVNNTEISPSFVNSLYSDPSHPYMAAPLQEQKKIYIHDTTDKPKSFDVRNFELYNYFGQGMLSCSTFIPVLPFIFKVNRDLFF